MGEKLDETHDGALRSWVACANAADTDFPIQNLPHAVFRRHATNEPFRGGVAIGTMIVDLAAVARSGAFEGQAGVAMQALERAAASSLEAFMAAGPPAWRALRLALSRLLREGAPEAPRLSDCLVAQVDAEYTLPARIGDYTDFFSSYDHMLNVGRVMQPDRPVLPNFKWLPIAYHGRASSIEVSGAELRRPWGQIRGPGDATPRHAPTRKLDYELELGAFVGPGNARGERIALEDAEDHVFGLCLLNDWSARDVQSWESMPLGPFLAKNFLSTVSPWVVTLEALAPFRSALPRAPGDPPTLPHLRHAAQARPGLDIELEVWLTNLRCDAPGTRLSQSNFRHAYWSIAQMVAHHTEGGCNLRPGDLLGSGTQSGPGDGEQGCLIELTRDGQRPLTLADGETRSYLADGDVVTLRAWCRREGFARIGFGDCRGRVAPAAD
jgi:fumarylacetoacetase